ncbi:hypothetical protein PLICRDRAFT_175195 [Plicaturopsis crispa FD-325 SS-3]|nr:hypothetical protein PLICRDRAFT_175195 [Plicaturopsis crispa FD-325 SS-3]
MSGYPLLSNNPSSPLSGLCFGVCFQEAYAWHLHSPLSPEVSCRVHYCPDRTLGKLHGRCGSAIKIYESEYVASQPHSTMWND